MGPLSKNQFYMVHANKRDKGNIRAAAILATFVPQLPCCSAC